MKICHICSVFPRSDADTEVPWFRRTIRLQVEQGHDVTVFVPSFKGLKSHTIDGKITVKRWRYFPSRWEDLTHDEGGPNKIHKFRYKFITLFYIFFGCINIALFHSKEKFSILHVHWPFPHGLFSSFATLFCKAKVVMSFYGAELLLVNRFSFVKWFLRYFIKHTDEVIAISKFTGKTVTDIYNRPIHIIPYGTTIEPDLSHSTYSPSRHIFSVGRMIERKGFIYLIEAIPEVLKQFPDAKLTITGGGPVREQLIKRVNELNLQNSVNLPGKVPNETLEQLFTEGDIFVCPSIIDKNGDTEGLGVVMIEAMTYNKPVIATDVGGIPDIIVPGLSGILVEQKSSLALANAIIDLLKDPVKMVQLGKMGNEFAAKQFSWKRIISLIDGVYEKALQNK